MDSAKLPLSNAAQRVITGLVVAPIIIVAVLAGGWVFAVVIVLIAALGVSEFYVLAHDRPSQGSTLVGVPLLVVVIFAFYLGNLTLLVAAIIIAAIVTFVLETIRHSSDIRRSLLQVGMTLVGVLYVGFPAGFLVYLRGIPNGVLWILLILCVTWSTDSFAYIGGRRWGKRPLAPRLSPKKTVEGAVAGIIGGIVLSLILLAVTNSLSLATVVFVVLAPLVAIAGDLLESALKRFYQAKDSHIPGLDLLPGHGGILDRTDALLLVTAWAFVVFWLLGAA